MQNVYAAEIIVRNVIKAYVTSIRKDVPIFFRYRIKDYV
jgi:hypothetical protein